MGRCEGAKNCFLTGQEPFAGTPPGNLGLQSNLKVVGATFCRFTGLPYLPQTIKPLTPILTFSTQDFTASQGLEGMSRTS